MEDFISALEQAYRNTRQRVRSAISRCCNPRDPGYRNYGGRGIKVYKPWLSDWNEFVKYLTTLEGWTDPNLVMDRINNDGNYEPGNIRFVTYKESRENQRQKRQHTQKYLEKKGLTLKAKQKVAVEAATIRAIRAWHGIKQEDLASEFKVPQSMVSKLERYGTVVNSKAALPLLRKYTTLAVGTGIDKAAKQRLYSAVLELEKAVAEAETELHGRRPICSPSNARENDDVRGSLADGSGTQHGGAPELCDGGG